MSDPVVPQHTTPGVQADQRTLGFMRECGLTVEMDARALRRLHAEIEKVLAAATSPVSTIRENCGSDPASLPGQLVTVLQMGVGYFRAAADTIKALFKARNAARRSHRKKGDK